MPTPLYLVKETGFVLAEPQRPWTVLDRNNVEVGRYTSVEAFAAMATLNGPLGDPTYQPYTVAWAGDDRRSGTDRRRVA